MPGPVYSNFPGPGRFLVRGVYNMFNFSGPRHAPVLRRIQKARKVRAPGRNLYTQIFRARAGSCSGAYTASSKSPGSRAESVYSKIQGPGRFLIDSVYRKLKEPGPRAESVYSNFPGPGRLLFWGVYRKLEKLGPRAESVYSNFPGPDRFLLTGVYRKLEEPGPRA